MVQRQLLFHACALIAPDRPRNMGDGWETRRRRDVGPETHDAVMISFAVPADLRRLEIDTSRFVFNASSEVSVLGSRARPMRRTAAGRWCRSTSPCSAGPGSPRTPDRCSPSTWRCHRAARAGLSRRRDRPGAGARHADGPRHGPAAPTVGGIHGGIAVTAPSIRECTGLWRRTLLIDADGSRDTGTDVCGCRASPPTSTRAGSRAGCISTATSSSGSRDVDLEPPGPLPDAGSMRWDGDVLIETGVHAGLRRTLGPR